MKTLVTGGAGFIGSHLVDALIEAGDEVVTIDDLSTGRESNLEGALAAGAKLVRGDLRDADLVRETVSGFAPDRVFHLAAQADVRKAVADPAFDADVNVLGTVRLLDAVQRAGGAPVVFASTGGVTYGEGEGKRLPFVETDPVAPITAYAVSKLSGESYVGLYRRLYGMAGVALRFGNVYGPRQDPHGEAGVVAIFCGKLLAGESPTVFGDGQQTRDYVYIDDVVQAMLAASAALAERGTEVEGPFNIGTGREGSVLDLLEVLGPLSGEAPEHEFAPARTGEVQRVAIDPSLAGEQLGWSPSIKLEEGLPRTFESVRGN